MFHIYLAFLLFFIWHFSVVRFQIDIFQLGYKRISRVGTGTLVIEGLLGHLIQSFQEMFLIYAVITDRRQDLDSSHKLIQFSKKLFEYFCIVLACKTYRTSDLSVACKCLRILILLGKYPS
mgnify:CR=1 FL=1